MQHNHDKNTHNQARMKTRPINPIKRKIPISKNAIMVQTPACNLLISHLPERIARSTTALLGPELGFVVLHLWLLLLRLGSGHEADLVLADDAVLARWSLLGLHGLCAGAE